VPRQTELDYIRVAAGILRDERGSVLISERVGDHAFAGLWEFPGGKIGEGEASTVALRREMREELGIEILDQALLLNLEHEYPDRSVSIDFYLIEKWLNAPEGRDGQAIRWIDPAQLSKDLLLPADGPVIEALQRL
jgi:8-oxo-dGTP diphosphatase